MNEAARQIWIQHAIRHHEAGTPPVAEVPGTADHKGEDVQFQILPYRRTLNPPTPLPRVPSYQAAPNRRQRRRARHVERRSEAGHRDPHLTRQARRR